MVANSTLIGGSLSASGSSHGSEPFASWPSVSRITGVMYFTAMRTASYAQSKQSAGVDAAIIGIGDSPCRPYIDCSKSACSGLVGIPVEGPARWMSVITIGSSTLTASPTASALRFMPGPEVVVIAIEPPNAAPIAAHTPAISSSAWKV